MFKRIAREVKITATDAEVTALMSAQAMRSGHRTAQEWMKAAKLKEKDVRDGLRQDLLTSKTIDFLLANAELTGDGAAEAGAEAAAEAGARAAAKPNKKKDAGKPEEKKDEEAQA